MQQMILQTALPIQTSLTQLFQPNFQQHSKKDQPVHNQQQLSLKSSNKYNEDSIAITPFDGSQTLMTRNSTDQNRDDEAEVQWPQIQSIITKIRNLQRKLKDSCIMNEGLNQKIAQQQSKVLIYEQQKAQLNEKLVEYEQSCEILNNRIKQLEQELEQKQILLVEKQQFIEEVQFTQFKKRGDYQQKIKKMNTENKELLDKLRKANLQLQKQRKLYKQLKQSMASQMQQMHSHRQEQLIDEIHKLKEYISNTKEEKQMLLYEQIDKLSRQLYLKQEQVKRKNIELNLCDRKKHQAVNDIIEKKDAQMKVQKSLFKALHQKMNKLQEQIKSSKHIQPQHSKNRLQRNNIDRQEEISFHLSPDRE